VTTLVVAVLAADAPSLWRAPITQLIGAAEPPPPVGEKSKEKVGRQGAEKATGDLTETAVEKSVDEGTIDQAVAERRADKSADREAADVVDSLDSPRTKAARERAKLLHEVFATTLDVIHERYFHGDRAAVPARAMEDVFQQLQRSRNIQARWIGVNARTMSLPHEPKDDFERAAAKAIREGKGEYEAVENGFYRRAEAIPLDGGCLSCHGTFGAEVKSPRFAGLVLRISLKDKR
jgi:DNA-binding transcriptional regulator YiaG